MSRHTAMLLLLLPLLPLLGCPPEDSEPTKDSEPEHPGDNADTGPTDADGDGYPEDEDCDDSDASVHPGAVETWYDGVDSDCDEASDYDQDGDGYDHADHGGEDCDDLEPLTHPGADELPYNDEDDDCDEATPDDDLDGDGFSIDEDCDDDDEAVNPDAEELCGDGVDDDCDETTACGPYGEWSSDQAHARLLGDAEEDYAGLGVAGVGDTDGDGLSDIAVGAPYFDLDAGDEGQAALFLGPLTATASLSEAWASFRGGTTGDRVGVAIAAAGDANLDGLADLWVGSELDNSESYAGAVYLLLGPLSGTLGAEDAQAKLYGEDMADSAGSAIGGGGDLNGDGLPDLVVGARFAGRPMDSWTGAVYVAHSPFLASEPLVDAGNRFYGEEGGDYAGNSVALAPDTDGDGYDDVLVGAYQAEGKETSSGAAYVLIGPASHGSDLGDASSILRGEELLDQAGYAVAGAGDTNGDGYGDVLVGAIWADHEGETRGKAYLALGPLDADTNLRHTEAQLVGEDEDDEAGAAVSSAGDVDGDGLDDVLVGAPLNDEGGEDAGAFYLVLGPMEGTASLEDADGRFYGSEDDARLGWSVAGAGDTDGDGYGDLLAGAPYLGESEYFAGGAFLFLGGEGY